MNITKPGLPVHPAPINKGKLTPTQNRVDAFANRKPGPAAASSHRPLHVKPADHLVRPEQAERPMKPVEVSHKPLINKPQEHQQRPGQPDTKLPVQRPTPERPQNPSTRPLPMSHRPLAVKPAEVAAMLRQPERTEAAAFRPAATGLIDGALDSLPSLSVAAPTLSTAPADDSNPAALSAVNPNALAVSLEGYITGAWEGPGLHGAAATNALSTHASPTNGSLVSLGGLNSLTQALYDRLSTDGFATQPPTNIRELVEAFELSPRQTDFMMKQMAKRYPAGLGVNVVG